MSERTTAWSHEEVSTFTAKPSQIPAPPGSPTPPDDPEPNPPEDDECDPSTDPDGCECPQEESTDECDTALGGGVLDDAVIENM